MAGRFLAAFVGIAVATFAALFAAFFMTGPTHGGFFLLGVAVGLFLSSVVLAVVKPA